MACVNEGTGRKIRDRRLALGYTSMTAAAAVAGVGSDTWGKMERGQLPKSAKVQKEVARLLRWKVEDLFAAEPGPDFPAEDPTAPDPALLRRLSEVETVLGQVVRVTSETADDVAEMKQLLRKIAADTAEQ